MALIRISSIKLEECNGIGDRRSNTSNVDMAADIARSTLGGLSFSLIPWRWLGSKESKRVKECTEALARRCFLKPRRICRAMLQDIAVIASISRAWWISISINAREQRERKAVVSKFDTITAKSIKIARADREAPSPVICFHETILGYLFKRIL